MRVTSTDTGLKNANINTIYQITIVHTRIKRGGSGGGGDGGGVGWDIVMREE